MAIIPNPCKDCPSRYHGCHSKCDKYKEWKAEWDKIKEKERIRKDQLYFRRKY